MPIAILLLFLVSSLIVKGQNYFIGAASYSLPDPDRPGRNVQVKLYYPAQISGNNAPWAAGSFPLVSFGHGFAMAYTAYQNIWEYFVPRGYVMAMVDMENGIFPAPSHSDFGRDLLFAARRLLEIANQDASDPLFGKLNGKAAFMGHSMGGGSSVLGAALEPGFPDAVVGLSPAETNPSSISAASGVISAFLMLAGEKDMVTPPASHQLPIFNALGSTCKVYAEIKGGVHCFYALPDLACDFGETTSGSQPAIDRAQQQQATYDIVWPFLEWKLKGAPSAPFFYVLGDNRFNVIHGCEPGVGFLETIFASEDFFVQPLPGQLQVKVSESGHLTLYDRMGRVWQEGTLFPGQVHTFTGLPAGLFFCLFQSPEKLRVRKVLLP
ncbi:MAG: hypothetical protein N2110_02055 [Flavobacteriales bacterium]|nr:hypothetical protein [Flavobacteriales bacterium]